MACAVSGREGLTMEQVQGIFVIEDAGMYQCPVHRWAFVPLSLLPIGSLEDDAAERGYNQRGVRAVSGLKR